MDLAKLYVYMALGLKSLFAEETRDLFRRNQEKGKKGKEEGCTRLL